MPRMADRTTVELPRSVYDRLRVQAAAVGLSVPRLIERWGREERELHEEVRELRAEVRQLADTVTARRRTRERLEETG